VYAGERIAQITAPNPTDRIAAGQTLQIVGSAYIDDFSNYTLDVGQGDNPTTWTPITDQRKQAVDKALLGVWNTSGLAPGRYRLRLRAFDSFENAQESPPLIVMLAAPPTPTPQPTATRAPTLAATPTVRVPTPGPAANTAQPTPAPQIPTATAVPPAPPARPPTPPPPRP
jgi:hypothetical protein